MSKFLQLPPASHIRFRLPNLFRFNFLFCTFRSFLFKMSLRISFHFPYFPLGPSGSVGYSQRFQLIPWVPFPFGSSRINFPWSVFSVFCSADCIWNFRWNLHSMGIRSCLSSKLNGYPTGVFFCVDFALETSCFSSDLDSVIMWLLISPSASRPTYYGKSALCGAAMDILDQSDKQNSHNFLCYFRSQLSTVV